MDILRGLLGVGKWIENRMHGLESYAVAKGVDERIRRWFGHIERMENDRTAKRVYVGECVGSRPENGRGGLIL